jgi:hypothetical protein
MGRTHDFYCFKCGCTWSPLSFNVCPGCDTDKFSIYDLNNEEPLATFLEAKQLREALRELAEAPDHVDGYWLRKFANAALGEPNE